jgi:hypothetical protein
MMSNPKGTPERLIYWYLRLNGFLLLENFIIHPEMGGNQRTEADLLGVRFKHRSELLQNPMKDDPKFVDCTTFCNVIIAEVKRGQCALNGPWTRSDQNMLRILRAIGCFEENAVADAARALYNNGRYQTDQVTCRLLAFGNREGEIRIQDVPQIFFSDVIEFIYQRFQDYSQQKASIGNWPTDGQKLRELADTHRNSYASFERDVRALFGLLPVN